MKKLILKKLIIVISLSFVLFWLCSFKNKDTTITENHLNRQIITIEQSGMEYKFANKKFKNIDKLITFLLDRKIYYIDCIKLSKSCNEVKNIQSVDNVLEVNNITVLTYYNYLSSSTVDVLVDGKLERVNLNDIGGLPTLQNKKIYNVPHKIPFYAENNIFNSVTELQVKKICKDIKLVKIIHEDSNILKFLIDNNKYLDFQELTKYLQDHNVNLIDIYITDSVDQDLLKKINVLKMNDIMVRKVLVNDGSLAQSSGYAITIIRNPKFNIRRYKR